MNHHSSSPADFLDPVHSLDPDDRRGAFVSIFVPWFGLLWIGAKLFRADKEMRLVYVRFMLPSMLVTMGLSTFLQVAGNHA